MKKAQKQRILRIFRRKKEASRVRKIEMKMLESKEQEAGRRKEEKRSKKSQVKQFPEVLPAKASVGNWLGTDHPGSSLFFVLGTRARKLWTTGRDWGTWGCLGRGRNSPDSFFFFIINNFH